MTGLILMPLFGSAGSVISSIEFVGRLCELETRENVIIIGPQKAGVDVVAGYSAQV